MVVPADVHRLALHLNELVGDRRFLFCQRGGERREARSEVGIIRLGGECLRPVLRDVEVRATVVELATSARRRLVIEQILRRRLVERLPEDPRRGKVVARRDVLERGGQRKELSE